MKKQITTRWNGIFTRQSKGYSLILKTICALALLFAVLAPGCKKDDYKGEIKGTCPVVVSTDPLDKAVDVVLTKAISVTFNTSMAPASINSKTFTIKQGAATIAGTIAPTSNGTVFIFTPSQPLLPFVSYTGTITTGATDTLHTALVKDYIWTFTSIPQVTLTALPVAGGTVEGFGTFAQASVVTVTATPNTGYVFTNWTDNGTIVSTSSSYQFTMAGNRVLVANFKVIPASQFAVVLNSSPVAGGTTKGSGSYNAGTSVTVTALPNAGYIFVNWTDNGNIVSTSSGYQFILGGNRKLIANFKIIPSSQFAVILSSSPPDGGSTTGSGAYSAGTSVTVSAAANSGYTFVNWTDNGVVASTSTSYTFALNANRTLIANFAKSIYTLALSAKPTTGGTVTGAGSFSAGSSVTALAVPKSGYDFVSWTDNGVVASTNASYTFILNGSKALVANFVVNTVTLNVTAVNGSVIKNPNQLAYSKGAQVKLTATANAGYVFTSWSGDATGSVNPLTVTMNANKNITANFKLIAASPVLGSISKFGAFGGNAGITNQGLNTVINNGGIGTTAASTLVTGFHDGLTAAVYTETPLNKGNVKGGIFTAPPAPGTATSFAVASQALIDATIAYNSISPASKPGGIDPGAGELGGLTLAPGIYKSASGTFKITNGNLTLDAKGDPNAVWIFQTAAGLTVGIAGPAGARSVVMINGGLAKNVFWYVGSAATINAAGGGIMTGTIISSAGTTLSTAGNAVQTVLNGRAISLVASVTMVNTTVNVPQ
ncbi:InlB B-repeat-containing protein [Mucilaginibacter xinganensis]|uniref:Cell wall/surface repeat protein n=1 Tax=Mucilaginibacter xinganensis TaxID=1234841 RepID=A0A223P2U5_9SPHI|nr:ice-binding family protein [Mucilaginibacter xinganensis]ASU36284.1 cell wall/surface repeat protein [Mucilaginibacter xinganensis]